MAFGLRRGPMHPAAVRMGAALFGSRQAAPSAVCDYHHAVSLDGNALGNDTIGNCLPAGELRLAQIRMANAWGSSWAPTTDQAIHLYSLMTGYDSITGEHDDGTFPSQAQSYLYRTGMDLGLQSVEVVIPAAVDYRDADAIRTAIETYGGIGLQFALPAAWEALGDAPNVWDIPAAGLDSPAGKPGGWADHFVPSGKYDGQYFYVISWGREIPVTLRAVAAYCFSASCGLSRSWIEATTGKTPGGLTWNVVDQLRGSA